MKFLSFCDKMVDRQHLQSVFRDMSTELVRKKTRNRSNFSPIPLNQQVELHQMSCPTISDGHRQQDIETARQHYYSSSSCNSHEHLGIYCANDLPYFYQDDWKRPTPSSDQMHYRQQKYCLSPNQTNNNNTYAARMGVNSFSNGLFGHQGEVEQPTSMGPLVVPTLTDLKNLPVVKEEEQKLRKIQMEEIEASRAYENAFDLLASFMGERTDTVAAQSPTFLSSFALPKNSKYVANASSPPPEEGVAQSSLWVESQRKMIPSDHSLLASPDMTSGLQPSASNFSQPSSLFFDDRVGVEESTCSKMAMDAKYGHSRNATCSMVALMFRGLPTVNIQQFSILKNWLNALIDLASDWVAFEFLGFL